MTALRLPRGVVHSDPACHHLRRKAACETLVPPAAGEVCRDCRKRADRRRDADRAAHEAAVRERAREEIARDPDAVIEYLLARGRSG